IASSDLNRRSAEELSELMRANTRLDAERPSWFRPAAWGCVALAIGATIAAWTRPAPYLEFERKIDVPTRDSVLAQLLHAKLLPSEAAWKAVEEKFPDADEYHLDLAKQGLLRFYLLVSEEWKKAEPLLKQYQDLAATDGAAAEMQAFTYACLCIVKHELGDDDASRAAAQALTPDLRTDLSRRDPQLYEALTATLSQIGE
ncbi:MAG: hypothetical protein KDA61_19040, partial [Planctomycetales bacterium]|nr:hypothetical protein [Planctomycetales bacterium]